MKLGAKEVADFREIVWDHYKTSSRDMPWRINTSPYYVLVSELMLQQTQVSRVIPKFDDFMDRFPDIATLAQAGLSEVLSTWSGLGYNRRAKFLHESAKGIVKNGGSMPTTYDELLKLPGVGENTAAAIMNYAYQKPTVFIETNIRTVYFHYFFSETSESVDDKTLRHYVKQTLDREHPREWFWALMDYGSFLKKTSGGRLSQSTHYKKQSALSGSLREMRGRIIKTLTEGPASIDSLKRRADADERFERAIHDLQKEGLIELRHKKWCLTGYSLPS